MHPIAPVATARWKETYSPDDLQWVGCPLCGDDEHVRLGTEFSLGIVRCSSCQQIYVSPRPRDSEKNYWAASRDEVEAKYGPIFDGRRRHDRDTLYVDHLRLLGRYAPGRRLLDIGTHCGFFLRHAAPGGWLATGVEPSPTLASLAREKFGLDVRSGALEAAELPNDEFDAVTVLDVIEHVHEPARLLAEARRVTRPGGVILVKTPNGRYSWLKHVLFRRVLRRRRYDCFGAREHIAAYTDDTLRRLVARSGWTPVLTRAAAPVQTHGSSWLKRAGRRSLYELARLQQRSTGRAGTFATDLLLIARK